MCGNMLTLETFILLRILFSGTLYPANHFTLPPESSSHTPVLGDRMTCSTDCSGLKEVYNPEFRFEVGAFALHSFRNGHTEFNIEDLNSVMAHKLFLNPQPDA